MILPRSEATNKGVAVTASGGFRYLSSSSSSSRWRKPFFRRLVDFPPAGEVRCGILSIANMVLSTGDGLMSSNEQVAAFFVKLESDEQLLERVKNVKSVDELVALASEAGFEVTEDEVKSYFETELAPSEENQELSEEELEKVAGGLIYAADSGNFIYKSILGRRGGGDGGGRLGKASKR
ncbi:MAG: Nif11-like leader peptide family natural product precursor [Planctomycetota bacterium]|nr:MAG: Nif11-like leader peptide family natural product precursor [Planctomycetota bacterium]